jgi:hypothetical protein
MTDWHPCDVCGMAHPFRVSERACPNGAGVKETGLMGLAALRAMGVFAKWDDAKAINVEAMRKRRARQKEV